MDNVEQTLKILSNATGTNTELLNIKVSPGAEAGDIVLQLDGFNEQNEAGKVTKQSSADSINLNSHHEVFQAIMQQVSKTSHEIKFLTILQYLRCIDPNERLSDVMWKVTEKLVHRAIQLENSEEGELLIRSCRPETNNLQNDNENEIDITDSFLTAHSSNTSTSRDLTEPDLSCPPPSPVPCSPSTPHILISSPPLPSATSGSPPSLQAPPAFPPPVSTGPIPPPPPPMMNGGHPLFAPNQVPQPKNLLLPQYYTPKPTIKLKTCNWTTIPPHKIINKLNIWTIMANDYQYKYIEVIDFKGIEGLFCLQTTNENYKRTDETDSTASRGKKDKEPKHIHLLDVQSSLEINIFLSQFKGYNSEDIVQLIRTGDHKILNLEKLQDLIKIFQKDKQIMLLKEFVGDRQRLANAEKFLISMLEVSNFKLRIESMILKEEFALNVTYLEPCLNAIIKAGNDLMKSKTLQEILGFIMIIGNFLNSDGYAGNALGIKLSSLIKLTETKANKPDMHLLHLIAMEVQKYSTDLLDLSNELNFLDHVSKLNNDQIEKDIRNMEFALNIIKKEVSLPTTEEDIKQQMDEFIKKAEEKIGLLNKQVEELKSLRIQMADFFCEDVTTFKIHECFGIFYKFCEQFKQALKENEKRQQLELKAKIRQKQKEEQLAQATLRTLLPPKRVWPSKGSMEANNMPFDRNSKKNEDDLMTWLQTVKSVREKKCIRRPRLDKRPDLLTSNYEREREQRSSILMENNNENLLPNSENSWKAQCSDKQKPWRRLMQSYKGSQLQNKCSPPEKEVKDEKAATKNNTTENYNEITFSKTPNKSSLRLEIYEHKEPPNEIDMSSSKKKSPIEIKQSRVTLKTMAVIAQLGCRYSSINEEDLKKTIKKLRTPTMETSQLCFSPLRELLPKSSIILSPTAPVSGDRNLDPTPKAFNSVDEEKTELEIDENIKCNQNNL